jgi:FlaA1/EpsC-like NDP-sugar epimerase
MQYCRVMPPPHLYPHRRWINILLHVLLVPLGYFAAFGIRFDFTIPPAYLGTLLETLPLLLAARLAAFALFKICNGWWRHAGIHDLLDLIKAITTSSALFLVLLLMVDSAGGVPRSVLLLDWATAIFLFGGLRFAVRVVREERPLLWRERRVSRRALILGAGEGAERLLRDLRRDGVQEFLPVGLIDDDSSKRGMRLHGVPVLGTTAVLSELVRRYRVGLLVIAIPSATREQMQHLVEHSMAAGVEFKIVPALRELLDGTARVSQLRNVEIEDLLGREPVELDMSRLEAEVRGRVAMVTGGAGSIGSELARQLACYRPARLLLLDQAESPLYFVHLELQRTHPDLEVIPLVADVTDESRIAEIFARYHPDFVYHAAAYKHVPLMEANAVEAVRTNVLGTLRVAECAARNHASRFVLISTDKAVYPSSVMGATKRVAERIVLGWPSLARSTTDFRAVRFGNVLGSDGSVVPLFRRQLAHGGPLTVTHPEVTRYFMTIPEAVQLVLRASVQPEAAGRIAMLEMGEPVRIADLAENLVRLSGLTPYRDVPIIFTGLRPGEKLHEELMSEVEQTVSTAIEKVRVVQTDETDVAQLQRGVAALAAAAASGPQGALVAGLCALVPECVPPLRDRWAQGDLGGTLIAVQQTPAS